MTPLVWLYSILLWPVFVLWLPVVIVKSLYDARYRRGWLERLTLWSGAPKNPLWIHCASVGEVRASAGLIEKLAVKRVPLLVTTTTPSGRNTAAELLGDKGAARLMPLELFPLALLLMARVRPTGLVVVETELWPALLSAADLLSVPRYLVSGRISDNSYPRYLKVSLLLRPLLKGFVKIQAQSECDMERFVALGAPVERVTVGGNLKFDIPAPDSADHLVRGLRRARAAGWRVFVAGSVHPGELAPLLDGIKRAEEGGLKVGFVLAPRHMERLEEIEAGLDAAGRKKVRWSELAEPLEVSFMEAFGAGGTVVVDGYGLLGKLYGGGEAAFVGGSLVDVGGHSLLEPLAWGVPVMFGPHMQNSRAIRDEVVRAGLGGEVVDSEAIAAALKVWLNAEEGGELFRREAESFFSRNRGGAERVLAELEMAGLLDRVDEGHGR